MAGLLRIGRKKIGFANGNTYRYEIHWYENINVQFEHKLKRRKEK